MSLHQAWAAWGADLLWVAGLVASGLGAMVGTGGPWAPHLGTAWTMACLGAWVWALAQPTPLGLGSALALTAGRLAALSWGLEALALPMAFAALVAGMLAHLGAWWPPLPGEAQSPAMSLLLDVAWGLVLGGWALGGAARWARWRQGPRGLAQSSGDRDLGALARWAMLGPALGGSLWLGLWLGPWWGEVPWGWRGGHAFLGAWCAVAAGWAWREGKAGGARLQAQPLGEAKGLGALTLGILLVSLWAYRPPLP